MDPLTIRTPVEGYSGKVAGVDFVNGVGQTTDPNAANYFRRHGYQVGDAVAPSGPKPVEKMTAKELKEHAAANNIDLAGATKKEEILAVVQAAASAGDASSESQGAGQAPGE